MNPIVTAIILAAGESKRIGTPKQLLPLGQNTILGQTIDNFLSSKLTEIVVVVGYRAQEIINEIGNRPVKVITNPNYQQGIGTSIAVGLTLISSKVQGIMIGLADQPFIDGQTIDRLIKAFSNSTKGIVIPVHKSRRGNPIIFKVNYKKELLLLKGDIGGREIIAKHSEDVIEVNFDSDNVVIDIDTENKYDLAKDRITKLQENL